MIKVSFGNLGMDCARVGNVSAYKVLMYVIVVLLVLYSEYHKAI